MRAVICRRQPPPAASCTRPWRRACVAQRPPPRRQEGDGTATAPAAVWGVGSRHQRPELQVSLTPTRPGPRMTWGKGHCRRWRHQHKRPTILWESAAWGQCGVEARAASGKRPGQWGLYCFYCCGAGGLDRARTQRGAVCMRPTEAHPCPTPNFTTRIWGGLSGWVREVAIHTGLMTCALLLLFPDIHLSFQRVGGGGAR